MVLALEHNKRKAEEKSLDYSKNKLLDSFFIIEKTDESGINDSVRNAEDLKEVFTVIY